jgi:arylsulfatase A-like enzyme
MRSLPNLIFIAIDNLRFDLISSYPDKTYLQDFLATDFIPETPTLNALADESFWFQTCVSAAGYTPPSFATIFTGAYPYQHGV